MTLTRRSLSGVLLAGALLPAPLAICQETRALLIALPAGGGFRAAEAAMAASQGADFLGVDVVATKDGVLLALPDIELSAATDVASHPEFAARRTTRFVGDAKREGWFVDDFTAGELEGLRLSFGSLKPPRGAAPAPIATFEEAIAAARAASVRQARVVGVWARLIRPDYFVRADLALEPKIGEVLRAQGYVSPAAAAFLVTPDRESLAALRAACNLRLVFAPTADLPDDEGLAALAKSASALALPAGGLLVVDGKRIEPAPSLARVSRAGLAVHALAAGAEAFPPPLPKDVRRDIALLANTGVAAIATSDIAAAVRGLREARPAGDRA